MTVRIFRKFRNRRSHRLSGITPRGDDGIPPYGGGISYIQMDLIL